MCFGCNNRALIAQPCMGFANKMASDVSEGILRAEHAEQAFDKKGLK